MDYMETLEAKKKALRYQQEQVDQLIEAAKAEQERDRQINLRGLFNRMDSLINASKSSFSEESIGEVREIDFGVSEGVAEAYMRTIDVEISGRYRDDHLTVTRCGVNDLVRPLHTDDPTLVVSFLIPFDMIDSDEFFISKLRQ